MTMPLSYNFQPQPPSHPKTTGGKRGPSAPISICSSNDESDSDTNITDFSPPAPSRIYHLETITSSPNSKTSVLSLKNLPSPRGHVTHKKSGLSYSPRSFTGNNGLNSSTNSYTLKSSNFNTNFSTVNGHNIDLICPSLPNSGNNNTSTSLLTNLNTSHNNTLSSNSNSLSKNFTPSLSLSVNNSNTTSSTIPAISNSALSPTLPTQNSINSSSNNTTNTNSSHDSSKENNSPSSSPINRSGSPSTTFAYEHDHDYENVASPCSSTASGPIYVRQSGFQHHAHEVVANKVKKKKIINANDVKESFRKREPTPPKLKSKRGTVPMKLRALPNSFWQQPNVAHQVSPATMSFPILPPLCNKDTEEVMEERPTTPPEEREANLRISERKVTVANTDLLFKLFEGIGEEKKTCQNKSKQINRTKKVIPISNTKGLMMGKDPFMMEDVTEKIFPQLTLEGSRHAMGGGNTSLQLVTLREGDRTLTFPSLSSSEQNCPQMLSELVMHI